MKAKKSNPTKKINTDELFNCQFNIKELTEIKEALKPKKNSQLLYRLNMMINYITKELERRAK